MMVMSAVTLIVVDTEDKVTLIDMKSKRQALHITGSSKDIKILNTLETSRKIVYLPWFALLG